MAGGGRNAGFGARVVALMVQIAPRLWDTLALLAAIILTFIKGAQALAMLLAVQSAVKRAAAREDHPLALSPFE